VDADLLRIHAESLALRKLLCQIGELVTQREAEDLSEEEFLAAVKERCEVHKHLELPHLQEIIEKLEQL